MKEEKERELFVLFSFQITLIIAHITIVKLTTKVLCAKPFDHKSRHYDIIFMELYIKGRANDEIIAGKFRD